MSSIKKDFGAGGANISPEGPESLATTLRDVADDEAALKVANVTTGAAAVTAATDSAVTAATDAAVTAVVDANDATTAATLANDLKLKYNASVALTNDLKAKYNAAVTLINDLKAKYNAAVVLIDEMRTDLRAVAAATLKTTKG